MGALRAEVVSITRGSRRADWRRAASGHVANARAALGMTHAEYAGHLAGMLGWRVSAEAVARWEDGNTPPGDVVLAAARDGLAGIPSESLLDPVPPGLPVSALAGAWVTAYQFDHAGAVFTHADIAHVTVTGDRGVQAVNNPPEPRTQGRATPFRNEAEGWLSGRHLIGTWRNTSDTRYYGSLHLAVLPGETVMEGHYTGLASDIGVSCHGWKWVRLGPGDMDGATLREPSAVHDLVAARTQDDPPLTLAEVLEDR